MSNGHICCLWGVCCPPEQMAAQLVGHFGMDEAMAQKVASEFAVFIPSALPATKAEILPADKMACEKRLRSLHRHVKRELIDILSTLGHDTEGNGG